MTTNQDRAAEVVGEAYQQAMESSVPSAWRGIIAQALADAGLLAPDPVPLARGHREFIIDDLMASAHRASQLQMWEVRDAWEAAANAFATHTIVQEES